MKKLALVHPILQKIDKIDRNKYLVHESLQFGILSYSFSYPVILHSSNSGKSTSMKSTIMWLTKVEMNFTIAQNQGFSIVEETIDIESILPIKKFLERLIRTQHALLFENIEYA
jgi:hypothetical protein